MRMPIVFAATLALAASASSQSIYVPDNNATTGTCNVIPFGHNTSTGSWTNQKYQCIITPTDMGNAQVLTICDLGFSPCVAGIRHFDSIEIVMAQTSATTLSSTFSANLATNASTVLSAKSWDWHNVSANTWTRIGLDKDYTYLKALGNQLVVQVTVTGAYLKTTSTAFPGYHRDVRQPPFAYARSGSPPATGSVATGALKIELRVRENDVNDFGTGCKGSAGVPALALTGSAAIGTGTVTMTASNLVANTGLLHVFGLARYEPAIDLALIGAPGCKLYQSTDVVIPGSATSGGTYTRSVKIPNDKNLICFRVYTQVFPADANANNWGRTATNFGRILPGL